MRAAPLLFAALLLAAAAPAALAQDVANAYFEFLMARHLESQGDAAGALAALNRASTADRGSAEIRAELAALHLRQNRRDEAMKVAREALELSDDSIEAHRILGVIHASNSDAASEKREAAQAVSSAQEAITHLERVVATPGAEITMHYALGRMYLRTNQPEKAVTALGRVLAQNPDSIQGRLTLASAHAAANNLQSAIETLNEIVDDDPRVASALGQYQERAGALKEAAESYSRALAISPSSRELKWRRVAVLYGAKEFERSAALAAEAQAQHPNDLRFVRLRARALLDAGAPARALAVLEPTAKANPKDVQTQFALADLYNEANRDADAERTLRQLLQMEPANADVLNYLGYLLAERGEQLDEAIRLVRRALDVDPGNPSYLDSLGWAHFRRGELEEAEKYLAPAAEKLPKNSVVQEHMGDVHARRGRWQEAIDAWTRALQGDGHDLDREAVEKKIQDARSKLSR